MSYKVHLFSTSRYFERAVQASVGGASLVYWNQLPNMGELQTNDVLFFMDAVPDWPLGLENAPCLTIMYLIDVHQEIESRLRMAHFFDVVFVAQKDYVEKFREISNKNAYWLPLAFDPAIHHLPSESRTFDVGFVGKLGLLGSSRYKLLTTVLPRFQTNDYKTFYSPIEMAKIYGRSKIVFNASINSDLNMRFFEALASGALLVTDRIENGLSDLFQEGIHYVGYTTVDEAIRKINYYLKNPCERESIAFEGQRVALAQHTYLHRWEEIIRLSHDKFGQAPARTYSKCTLGELYSAIFVSLRLPGRIPEVIQQYGLSSNVMRNLVKAWARWLNARAPFTPNALRARLRSVLAKWHT